MPLWLPSTSYGSIQFYTEGRDEPTETFESEKNAIKTFFMKINLVTMKIYKTYTHTYIVDEIVVTRALIRQLQLKDIKDMDQKG